MDQRASAWFSGTEKIVDGTCNNPESNQMLEIPKETKVKKIKFWRQYITF